MCVICNLLDKSFPAPKSLVRALYEVNPSSEHTEVIMEKAMSKMNEDEQQQFASELMLEMLRTS